ncbi:MAG: hypothetical protein ACKO3O_05855, partial [Gammaproteobacteria bacterium]
MPVEFVAVKSFRALFPIVGIAGLMAGIVLARFVIFPPADQLAVASPPRIADAAVPTRIGGRQRLRDRHCSICNARRRSDCELISRRKNHEPRQYN